MKYIAITGGLLSGVGKGLTASSIARILKNANYNVTFIKIDPYLNCNASNLSPSDHGEVFVLSDGGEVDLDFGNYERFMHINLKKDNNITTGRVFKNIIEKERNGFFNGKTVQITPHVTDYVVQWIEDVAIRKVLNGKECNSSYVQEAATELNSIEHNSKTDVNLSESIIKNSGILLNDIQSNFKEAEIPQMDLKDILNDTEKLIKPFEDESKPFKHTIDFSKDFIDNSSANSEKSTKKIKISSNSSSDNNPGASSSFNNVKTPKINSIASSYTNSEASSTFSDPQLQKISNKSSDINSIVSSNYINMQNNTLTPDSSFSLNSFHDNSPSEDLSELLENGLCGHNCNNTLETPDICIIELGGTIGDIESSLFVESLRQLRNKVGSSNFLTISVEYVPVLPNGEQKTKPVQNSIIKARGLGIHPDLVVIRCSETLTHSSLNKIANFGEIELENIFQSQNVESIYEIPAVLNSQKIGETICRKLGLKVFDYNNAFNLEAVFGFIYKKYKEKIRIGIVGKYISNADTYISLLNALLLSSAKQNRISEIKWIDAEKIENKEKESMDVLRECNGIVIAGGFGIRGTEGKIEAIKIARETNVPIIGICLGFQLQIIEYARNVLKIKGATSEEFIENPVNNNEAQKENVNNPNFKNKDGKSKEAILSKNSSKSKNNIPILNNICDTDESELNNHSLLIKKIEIEPMSVGTKQMTLKENSFIYQIYNKSKINERYRHKYEFNNEFQSIFDNSDLVFSGTQRGNRQVALELKDHPFFVGVQYHPEFLARPEHTHPLFDAFIKFCIKKDNKMNKQN